MRHLLATVSSDPDSPYFRWLDAASLADGWHLDVLPTFEAVRLWGAELYRQGLLAIVRERRPTALLTIPPFDWLDDATVREVRALGCICIGWLDEVAARSEAGGLDELRSRYDHLWTHSRMLSRRHELPWRRWPTSIEAVAVRDPTAPASDVALITAHSDEREAIARAIASAGYRVACFGPGWALGPLTRPSALGVLAKTKVAVSFDARQFVEASAMGVRQVIHRNEETEPYLREESGFTTPEECLERLAIALEREPPEPEADASLSACLAGLGADAGAGGASLTLQLLHASVAHTYEHRQLLHPASAAYAHWRGSSPEAPAALAGAARIESAAGHHDRAAELASRGFEATAPSAGDTSLFLRHAGAGLGLGPTNAVDPIIDRRAQLLAALVEQQKFMDALEHVRGLSPAERKATGAAFIPNFMNEESVRLAQLLRGERPMPP